MKEVILPSSGATVTIKRLTFGDDNDATREAMMYAEQHQTIIDVIVKREFLLTKSIVSAPFEISRDSIRSLDRKDGLALWTAYSELNEVTLGEGNRSETESSSEQVTKKSSSNEK